MNTEKLVSDMVMYLETYDSTNYTEKLITFYEKTLSFSSDQWFALGNALSQSSNERMKIVILWECINHTMNSNLLIQYLELVK